MPQSIGLLGIALAVLASGALAQPTGAITGSVTSAGGEPIAGGHVVVEGSLVGAATDRDGSFRIPGLQSGTVVVTASAVGFTAETRRVLVEPGRDAVVDFVLVPATADLGEVVVTARENLTRGPAGIRDLPGSAHYIGPRELRAFADSDPLRLLREVPGVNIQEEEGYGNRPNIGLRGTGSNRSSKITVMEDGVLIAPAPYTAPAAYYFPTVGRMNGVEVRKGASQVKFGPYTTGGAINLISTPIPSEFSGRAEAFIGQNQARNLHVHVGDAYRHGGFLLETYQSNVAGFKEIFPLEDLDTGFDKKDYLAKLRVNTSPDALVYQSLTLKLTRTDEVSNETYLGLTAEDFARSPLLRYAGSQVDRLEARHGQVQLRHVAVFSGSFDVSTTVYRNAFARNWYRVVGVRAPEGGFVGMAAILDRPEAHGAELAVVKGALGDGGALDEARLRVRANNREYLSTGIQSIAGLRLEHGRSTTNLELGLRYHYDEMDRFQWDDLYAMRAGRMNRVVAGQPGTESNRVEHARAAAAFAQVEVERGRIVLVPGLRYEHITLGRDDFGPDDPGRTGIELKTRANTVDVWIPGLAARYALTSTLSAFAGLHRGFAPPTSQEGVRPELSVNYEAGIRYETPALGAQVTAFFNGYDNLLGSDMAAGGGTGSTDQFNGGEVHALGVELSGSADLAGLAGASGFRIPARMSYTYTDATFQSSFESTFDPWGSVAAGDELPYVARHQAAGSAGAEWRRYRLDVRASYTGARRVAAGAGPIPESLKLPAHLVVDVAGEAHLDGRTSVFGGVRNVFDEVYVASRLPAGLRPGLPRTMLLGVRTAF